MASHTQTGIIDLTSTNAVRLFAEAGFESADEKYSTKSELEVAVDGVTSTVETLSEKTETIANPNLQPFFSMVPYTADAGYWSSALAAWNAMGDGWMGFTFEKTAATDLNSSVMPQACFENGKSYTLLLEWRNVTLSEPNVFTVYTVANANYQIGSTGTSFVITEGAGHDYRTVSCTRELEGATRAIYLRMRLSEAGSFSGELRLSVYEGEYSGPYKPYVGSYSETVALSNTVNQVKQTSESNSATIENLTKTLKTNADGTTSEEDIVHKVSSVEQNLDTFKTTVSSTYATKDALGEEVEARETSFEQLDGEIALRATKTEAYQVAQPNLAPITQADFTDVYNATTNPDGYWRYTPTATWYTQLEDGWVHVHLDNSEGTAAVNSASLRPGACPSIVPGQRYTILIEVRNNHTTGSGNTDMYIQQTTNNQFWGSGGGNIQPLTFGESTVIYSPKVADTAHQTEGVASTELFRYNARCAAGSVLDFEFRLSLYESQQDSEGNWIDYSGPYKPYSGKQLYASQAELKVESDRIDARVEKDGVISAINLSSESAKIEAGRVEINGTAIFSAISSDVDNAITDKGYATTEQAQGYASTAETNAKNAIPDSLSGFTNDLSMAWQGTCSTAAGTAAKVVDCAGFELVTGATVTVRFSTANTSAAAITLNVNSTGAKTLYVGGAATAAANQLLWAANAMISFTYDGTYWRVTSEPRSWYGACTIAAGTAAKTAAVNEVVLCKGSTVNLQMTNANTVASPTLNVTSLGAKAIYTAGARPTADSPNNWTAASTVAFVFDGQYFRYDSDAATKAKAAESAANSATDSKLESYSTTAQMTEAIDTASLAAGIEYIVGTQTAATNLWTGVTKESALVAGKSIAYYLPYAGNSTAATLDLTLAGGGTTGAKNIRQVYSTSSNTGALSTVTTHWPVGSVINMTYDGTQWLISNYNTNVNQIERMQHSNTCKAASANATGKSYAVASSTVVGYVQSLGGYQTVASGTVIDISHPILWGTGNVAASATFTNAYEVYPSCTLRNNVASWTGTQYAMAYLVGTISGNSFTVDPTVFTSTEPTSEDGKFYIPLGQLYSAYQMAFRTTKDLYAFLDGKFRQVTPTEIVASQYIYKSCSMDVASLDANTTWVTTSQASQDAWTTTRPEYDAGFPVIFVAQQKKRLDGTVTCTAPVRDLTTTIIDGRNIVTGSINAEKINAEDLHVSAANIDGTISIGAIGEGTQALQAIIDSINQSLAQLQNGLKELDGVKQALTFDPQLGLIIASYDEDEDDDESFFTQQKGDSMTFNVLDETTSTSTTLASLSGTEGFVASKMSAETIAIGDWAWMEIGTDGFGLKYTGA